MPPKRWSRRSPYRKSEIWLRHLIRQDAQHRHHAGPPSCGLFAHEDALPRRSRNHEDARVLKSTEPDLQLTILANTERSI